VGVVNIYFCTRKYTIRLSNKGNSGFFWFQRKVEICLKLLYLTNIAVTDANNGKRF